MSRPHCARNLSRNRQIISAQIDIEGDKKRPRPDGNRAGVLVGVPDANDLYALSHLPQALPRGQYALTDGPAKIDPTRA